MSEVKFQIALSSAAQELANQVEKFELQAATMTIGDQSQRLNAIEVGKKINGLQKQLEEERVSHTRPMDAAKKQVMDLYLKPIEICSKVVRVTKDAILAYDREEQRKADELQAKLKAEAEEKARKERERITVLAEKQMESGNKKAMALSSELGELQEKLAEVRQEIQLLTSKGESIPDELKIDFINLPKLIQLKREQVQTIQETTLEKVEETLERVEEVQIFTPIVAAPVQKVAGSSKRVTWKFRVTNLALVPREYMILNDVAVGGVVRAMKDQTNIPGIEAYSEEDMSFSRK